MKTEQPHLVLVTHHFPFTVKEAFLENEIPFLASAFARILIIARTEADVHVRPVPAHCMVETLPLKSPLPEQLFSLLLTLLRLRTACRWWWEEIESLRQRQRPVSIAILRKMLHDLLKSRILAYRFQQLEKKHGLQNPIRYSYWLDAGALAFGWMKGGQKQVGRAHRVDVYEEVNPHRYLSFRKGLLTRLNATYVISEHGQEYLQKTGLVNPAKIRLARLGTTAPQNTSPVSEKPFRIVSCSFVHPVKRVPLVAESLLLLHDRHLEWIHFGDGPDLEAVRSFCTQAWRAHPHKTFHLPGSIRNTQLLQFYQENTVDVFINVSTSEGIPVTMMEAQSFGIPIVALDVGGVREIVTPETGSLLPATATPADIASAVAYWLDQPLAARLAWRTKIQRAWAARFDAQKNYPEFIDNLLHE